MKLATLLEVAGLASIAAGAFLFSMIVGMIVAGIALIVLGLALERA